MIRTFSLALAMMLTSASALADWTLNGDASSLNFVSVKKSAIAEVHHFSQLSGSLSSEGSATLEIALASVETMIPIRNERMNQYLFETDAFPVATVSVDVDTAALEAMPVGVMASQSLNVTLSLHGKSKAYPVKVAVTKLSDNRLQVSNLAPVIVNAADFDLLAGIDKLKELAALPSISTAVPVTFQLVFEAAK